MQKILANELTVCAACVRRILVIAVACKTEDNSTRQLETLLATSTVLPQPVSNGARYGMEATPRSMDGAPKQTSTIFLTHWWAPHPASIILASNWIKVGSFSS